MALTSHQQAAEKPDFAQAAQKAQDARRRPHLSMGTRRGTRRRWVQAYSRYAAASAPSAGHPSGGWVPGRWASFSSLFERDTDTRPEMPSRETQQPFGKEPKGPPDDSRIVATLSINIGVPHASNKGTRYYQYASSEGKPESSGKEGKPRGSLDVSRARVCTLEGRLCLFEDLHPLRIHDFLRHVPDFRSEARRDVWVVCAADCFGSRHVMRPWRSSRARRKHTSPGKPQGLCAVQASESAGGILPTSSSAVRWRP